MDYRRYSVSAKDRAPLLAFMLDALRESGCRIIHHTPPTEAPFRISFETPDGDRQGIVAYAFLATRTLTRNRPADERSFQIKYGSKIQGDLLNIWQDPFGLYTTLFLGIDIKEGFFVGVDPAMHNPTKLFIRFEFKDEHAEEVRARRWHVWERQKRTLGLDDPVEVVVGGTRQNFLRYVQFERAAQGLDQGHRQLLADRPNLLVRPQDLALAEEAPVATILPHALAQELEMQPDQILDLISSARRLKMAVRGWVAEEHLRAVLERTPGISECQRMDEEGRPDIRLRYMDGKPVFIECKNVLRRMNAKGQPRLDFQRTRAAKSDPCSRYYAPTDFDVVAACLHAVTERWEFRFRIPGQLPSHGRCPGKVTNNIAVDDAWLSSIVPVLEHLGRATT